MGWVVILSQADSIKSTDDVAGLKHLKDSAKQSLFTFCCQEIVRRDFVVLVSILSMPFGRALRALVGFQQVSVMC